MKETRHIFNPIAVQQILEETYQLTFNAVTSDFRENKHDDCFLWKLTIVYSSTIYIENLLKRIICYTVYETTRRENQFITWD